MSEINVYLKNNEAKECCFFGAPDKPCGVGRADANPKTMLPNDT